ncbi:unnamed protein product [Chondrus crispus]|uniref:Uncharacterized protein n=1 Tax=Chondrus crispus TaxID=2769 RepID=R7QPJ3_CHOCR|nr:unnamed protein product [Chondrus crispus]CDF39994.1 unnamed protein product [Chondrus crispus]|eukprot:XP_005710288.1 unnamed protein product [Chondrus crispus]
MIDALYTLNRSATGGGEGGQARTCPRPTA